MIRIPIDEVTTGMKLARTLYYQYGGVMLAAGATLDAHFISRLRQFGYTSIYIYDEDTEDLVIYDYIDERARQSITTRVQALFSSIREEVARSFSSDELKIKSAQEMRGKVEEGKFRDILDRINIKATFAAAVENIIENLLSDREICMCVGSIKTSANYIYDHSLEVAIHSALIAKRLAFPRDEIRDIILGCLLHDIGYIFIPEDIRTQSRLTQRDVNILQQHAIYGYYLLRDRDDISLLSAHMAYQHHERQDGEGYPRGLTGTNKVVRRHEAIYERSNTIHRYSSIVAVPNYYDGLVSNLPYKKAIPPDEAIKKIRDAKGTMLNEEVVDVFLDYIPVYPLGTSIVVTSGKYHGWRGVVIAVMSDKVDKPVIRLLHDRRKKIKKPIDIDLKEEKEINIKAVWK